MENLTNFETDALLSRFRDCAENIGAGLVQGSRLLVELERRGVRVGGMAKGLFRHYRLLAAGALTGEAALALVGMQFAMPYVAMLPAAEQKAVATGAKKLQVAAHDTSGKLVVVERSLMELSQREVSQVFDAEGLRSIADQKRIVGAREVDRRRGSKLEIRTDPATEELIVGQIRIPVLDLAGPLKALGFKIERIK